MQDVRAITVGGDEILLDPKNVAELATRLGGTLLTSGDPDYDPARRIWNAMIDKRPAIIARCSGNADVAAAVRFAREHDLLVSVRCGGHSVAGNSLCDGGLMIDLSPMNGVDVEATARRARVQGGATWSDLDRETQKLGLATPGGIISTTGVAGLTLGGGFGWLSREHGLAADNLLSAELVTTEGSTISASATENPDLFWGIRGGGGNFGVVTSLEFALHEVGPQVLFGPTIYQLEDARDVLKHYRAFVRELPNECSVYVDLLTAPPLPFLPAEMHGTKIISVIQFYAGDTEEGERVLEPLREYGDPIADAVAPTPYTTAQNISDALYEHGARNYWKSHNLTSLTDETIDALVESAGRLPTPQSDILIHQLGGAIGDVAPDATAYPHRDTLFVVTPGGRWGDPSEDEACIGWVRDCYDALAPHATGTTYVNFVTEHEGREREAYGPNYNRLVELKQKHDPSNFFRLNQNIRPAS